MKFRTKLMAMVLIAAVLLVAATPVLARGLGYEDEGITSSLLFSPSVLDAALMLAITAFFKEQLGLKGKWVLLTAFLVGGFIWFAPLLIETFPKSATWLTALITFVEFYLGVVGSFDLTVNIGQKVTGVAR